MGIRYLIVPERAAPAPFTNDVEPVPADLKTVLAAQLDLKQLDLDAAVTIYRNEAAIPTRAVVPPGTGADASLRASATLDLTGKTGPPGGAAGTPVALPKERGYASYAGPVTAGTRVLLSATSSPRWKLEVDGQAAPRSKAFGWANAFDIQKDGSATLSYRTPALRYAALALQVVLWVLAAVWLIRMRLGRRRIRTTTRKTRLRRKPRDEVAV
jgi:hypothetical protein